MLLPTNPTKIGVYSQIEFIDQPRDKIVCEGEDVFFPCTYRGTTALPRWRINEEEHSNNRLPARHIYNGTGLVVANIKSSMDLWTYSCFFKYFGMDGLETSESQRAILHVIYPSKAFGINHDDIYVYICTHCSGSVATSSLIINFGNFHYHTYSSCNKKQMVLTD